MNTASIRVSYRPIRLGLCIAENAVEDLRQAIRLNSTLWGGKFNPIIPLGSDIGFARTLVRTFRVDVLLAVSNTADVTKFVREADYLPWPDDRRTLFITIAGSPLPLFLDVYHPLRKLSELREKQGRLGLDGMFSLPNLLNRVVQEGSSIADVLLCTFGDYPKGDYCAIPCGTFADRLLGTEYLPAGNLTGDYWKRLSPLVVTQHGLLVYKPLGGWSTPGVFVGDPASFSDLLTFWNLRAADIGVLFLPESDPGVLLTGAQDWMAAVAAFQAKGEPQCSQSAGNLEQSS